jgi:hypothetical protein
VSGGPESIPGRGTSSLDLWPILSNYLLNIGGSPAGAGNFSLHHRIQNGSGAHPASYAMGTTGSFPGSEAAGA